MNFLAHCLIGAEAGPAPQPALVVGGFLGDFVKGPLPGPLPPDLALGVRLHRRIDAYSNSHPDIRASCARFAPPLRRLAPVIVDVLADHFLARHWERYGGEPLARFARRTYRHIDAHRRWLPERGMRFFRHMRDTDLLCRYGAREVVLESLRVITRRLRCGHLNAQLEGSVAAEEEGLLADFHAYFPDLVAHARGWVAEQVG